MVMLVFLNLTMKKKRYKTKIVFVKSVHNRKVIGMTRALSYCSDLSDVFDYFGPKLIQSGHIASLIIVYRYGNSVGTFFGRIVFLLFFCASANTLRFYVYRDFRDHDRAIYDSSRYLRIH